MARTIGQLPRPWAIVIGIEEASTLGDKIRRLFPTVRFSTAADAVHVHQPEFDAAIVVGSLPMPLNAQLCVIQFDGSPDAMPRVVRVPIEGGTAQYPFELRWTNGVRAHRFTIDDEAEREGIGSLAERTLIPEPGSEYKVLSWTPLRGSPGPPEEAAITPFASDVQGWPLAGSVRRAATDDAGELWCLPASAYAEAAAWITAAVRRWTRTRPDRFPVAATWPEEPEWMTHAEIVAQDAVLHHEQHVMEIARQLTAETRQLADVRQEARGAADSGERRLLTAQGEDLVAEVAAALKELGFDVVDADALPEHAAGKQEALRITSGDWLCLAEVKGYATGNAKAGDLLKVNKAVEVYAQRTGSWPAARWYIVNQSFNTPPGQRTRPLHGSVEVGVFASSGGLVIDTRDLFRLRTAVQAGVIESAAARALLQQSTGVFEYPSQI